MARVICLLLLGFGIAASAAGTAWPAQMRTRWQTPIAFADIQNRAFARRKRHANGSYNAIKSR
jgi:hypothetical protein